MNGKLLSQLPDFLCGDKLINQLQIFPKYNKNIANEAIPTRLLALSELYDIYIPCAIGNKFLDEACCKSDSFIV